MLVTMLVFMLIIFFGRVFLVYVKTCLFGDILARFYIQRFLNLLNFWTYFWRFCSIHWTKSVCKNLSFWRYFGTFLHTAYIRKGEAFFFKNGSSPYYIRLGGYFAQYFYIRILTPPTQNPIFTYNLTKRMEKKLRINTNIMFIIMFINWLGGRGFKTVCKNIGKMEIFYFKFV